MNIAYYRKSKLDLTKTVSNLKREAEEKGLKVLGEVGLPSGKGKVISLANTEWFGNIIAADPNLIGLLPNLVAVYKKGDEVHVGMATTDVLGGITRNPAAAQVASEVGLVIKDLINKSAGVEPLKPKNIRLYSTTTCPYCKMEKSWLEANKIPHEVIYVDQDQTEAERMVQKTGQMGVPVTEVQYDDSEEFIVGFDKGKLSDILGI